MARILRPALLCGTMVGIAMACCWQWVVPHVASQVTESQSVLSGGNRAIKNVVLEARTDHGFTGLWVSRYNPELRVLEGVRFLRVGMSLDDARLIRADRASWDERIHDWRLEKGILETRDITDQRVEVLGAPDWDPEAVRQRGQEDVDCDLFSYDELIETRRARPNRVDVAMALHRHITYPLANLILLLLSLPFAIHFERGSRIERVLGAIGVCAAYLLFDLTCQNLGQSGWLTPVVAAWSPTILFGSLGVVMFSSMRT